MSYTQSDEYQKEIDNILKERIVTVVRDMVQKCQNSAVTTNSEKRSGDMNVVSIKRKKEAPYLRCLFNEKYELGAAHGTVGVLY